MYPFIMVILVDSVGFNDRRFVSDITNWRGQRLINSLSLVVHPLVLLSVADHHARAISRGSSKRVVGVLLGQDNGKTVNVANSFGLPFEEDEKDTKTWFLDHNYIEGMWEMFKKVNGELCDTSRRILCVYFALFRVLAARERMIGWYHSGPKLRASDQEINDLFRRFIARPVMVIIDVRPQIVGIPTDAYFAVEEIKDVSVFRVTYPVQIFRSALGWHRNP